jgi:hypothetical protein
MSRLLLIPGVLSALLLAAHLLRAGWTAAAIAVVLSPLLLLTRRPVWIRTLEALLVLGALEWLRTLVQLIGRRQAAELPYLRLAAILGGVALLAALSVPLLEQWRRRTAGGEARA